VRTEVFAGRERLKVIRVYAPWVLAAVMKVIALRDFAATLKPDGSMREHLGVPAITLRRPIAEPFPTSRIEIHAPVLALTKRGALFNTSRCHAVTVTALDFALP
jgi:hypothetical protein